jgi:hypothetical protein
MDNLIVTANRPVHLARRDACLIRTAEMLNVPLEGLSAEQQLARVGQIITLIGEILDHTRLAGLGNAPNESERDFQHYMGLVLCNAQSAHAFMKNEQHLSSDDHSFLARYLGVNADEVGLSAMNYRRWARDILAGLYQILRIAHGPHRALQRETLEAMPEADQRRYSLALESFTRDLAIRFPL